MGLPDPHAIAVMALTLFALYLFSRESIPIETSSLLVVALLAIGFSIFPYDAPDERVEPVDFFSGFGNEALITICALMMASQGLAATGPLAPVGHIVSRLWSTSPLLALGVVLLIVPVMSAFTNNTPLVVLMIPILTSAALRSGMSPSKVLMPMTFASQIGGMHTPIGTSLNLLVIGSAARFGIERFHIFDFIAPAALAAVPGILYLWLVAPRLLPARAVPFQGTSVRIFRGPVAHFRAERGERQDARRREEDDERRYGRAVAAASTGLTYLAVAGCGLAPGRSAGRARYVRAAHGVCPRAGSDAVLWRHARR